MGYLFPRERRNGRSIAGNGGVSPPGFVLLARSGVESPVGGRCTELRRIAPDCAKFNPSIWFLFRFLLSLSAEALAKADAFPISHFVAPPPQSGPIESNRT